ncbi:MEDS domain-containing protein [Natrinema salifodinae]|uniref:histidine kinase n=1 Tax=Natrinema salifodinae TaxID=1202768 RepID=A0A1I0NFB1_9EURY|nr:MEDS domain-containing protein [Natrinema salifodinae]SEV99976.1 PAS domain S-box-containing protein [Natrinema salifodinae]
MNQRVDYGDRHSGFGHNPGFDAVRENAALRGPPEPPHGHADHSTDHYALLYEDRDEQFAAAIPFIEEGLERDERCLYVADENPRDAVLNAMAERGIDVDAALDSGALSVVTPSDTYRRTGEFDRDAMVRFWEESLEDATSEGDYAGIRAAAEMTWALSGDDDAAADVNADFDLLTEYESVLNDVYRDEDYAVLCQYNRERFPDAVIYDVIRTHPLLVHDGVVSENVYYTPPEEFFGPEDTAREVERMTHTLRERTTGKAELKRLKDHFEGIFENSQDAIFINDPYADEILEANPAGCEMLGYTREELLSLGPSDCHPDELDEFREFVDTVFEESSGWTDDLTCRPKRGDPIPAEISASRITVDGRPCMLAIVRDVSERKERERAQRRLYEIAADPDRSFDDKLQAVFDLGCERFDLELGGLARIDPETDRFVVEAVSGDHEHLRPGAQVALSETYCRVFAGEDDETTACITDPERSGFEGTMAYEEFGVESYLGTRLEIEDALDRTFFFVSSDPRENGFSDDDRTFHHLMGQWVQYELERRQRERRLEEAIERLERSNERLERFAYAASHDLQEPLRMVSSYLQLIESRYESALDEDGQEFFGYAIDGAERMREMIDGLLAYSRIETQGEPFEPVDLDDVLDDVLTDLQFRIEERDADVEAGALPRVTGDPNQLHRLFRSLISNALEYSGDEPPRVELSAERDGADWIVAVRDEGIGIETDQQERIFEVFGRLHSRREYDGAGIGLALCKRIVERHDGEIRVESEPGEGSTFYVRLPPSSA